MVYIEKIVVKGFKSFGRETVTIRLSPGFTCVVGPNGSGKSNVIDAILFVLGQLSAKTLRATVFSDLLYKPPKPGMPPGARKAVVELHFNNQDRKLKVDADKVVIARELDESGKSVCRVNGKVVTRATVLDVLGSIGVDPNGYNLVLQGEIAQMVKVSPNDRRKLIEEIAGISAYDEQKERALKKLAESEANLGKVEAQLQERRRQLERLELEREDALKYTEIQSRMQQIRVDRLAWTILKAQSRTRTIKENLVERAERARQLEERVREVEKAIDTAETEIEEIDRAIDQITGSESARVSEQLGKASAALEHVRREFEGRAKELEGKRALLTVTQEQIAGLGREIEEATRQIEEKENRLKEVVAEVEGCEDSIRRLETVSEREQAQFLETTQKLQELNRLVAALDEQISEARSQVRSNKRDIRLLYEDIEDAKGALERAEAEREELERTVPEKRQELEVLEREEEDTQDQLVRVREQLSRVGAEVAETSKIVSETREELVKIRARQDALREAEEAFLRRKRAVARVLQLRDTGEVDGIYGTVAELGKINPDYAVAMEVAGGNRLSYIVVEDEDVATKCIRVLKQERVGRASFIPLNKIRTRAPGKLPDDDGVIGFALDLVSFDKRLQPAFEFVFSDTIVTEDFEAAKRIGFRGNRAVSLDGDLVERSGLVTGGHYQRQTAGLTLQIEDTTPEVITRLEGLENILAGLLQKQEELEATRQRLEKQAQDLSKKLYVGRMELERLEERLGDRQTRVSMLTERIEENGQRVAALERETHELEEEMDRLIAEKERIQEERDACNEILARSDVARVNQEIRDLKVVLERKARERDEIKDALSRLRTSVEERFRPRVHELQRRLDATEREIPTLEAQVRELEQELKEKEAQYETLRSEHARIEASVKDRRIRQAELKRKLADLRRALDETKDERTQNDKAIYRLQTEQARLENELVGVEAELANLADVREELEKRRSMREVTYRELDEMTEKIRELERELDEMGPVNMKSLTDYEAERERYEEIVDRKVKLEEEHKEILRFMEELEAEKTRKFLRVYNEIADNFSRVFAKLSPGGEAHLMLENPEHPLMGGIIVKSKPQGKDVVTLDAMSGGEKTLTGLALIFAVQMYSPASFYVFDEIDAALDDVNAHNVATLISEMSKSSQFIVVSLREATVSKADLLIGVSNQDGISRIVSVDLEGVTSTA